VRRKSDHLQPFSGQGGRGRGKGTVQLLLPTGAAPPLQLLCSLADGIEANGGMRCWAGERKNKERKIRHGLSGLFDVAGHRFDQGKIQEESRNNGVRWS
jgi:hypothetical protein